MSTPPTLQVLFDGPGAEAAARDLFSMGWFEAEWERRPEGTGRATPGVRAQVVAIAGGSVTVAEKVLGWWERQRKSEGGHEARLSVTFEVPSGKRVTLATADRDALVDVLRVLHLPSR